MIASPKKFDDPTFAPWGVLVGMESNVMILTLPGLIEEEHRRRVAAASAWARES